MAERVLVAMSGGVDSSVAAHLLKEQGYEVMGAFLRLGEGGVAAEKSRACCTVEDAIDARRVADRLGIPFYSFNYAQQFRRVIDYFVDEYQRGRTPNPCARCNQWIKFDTFHGLARDLGASFVATGHYARIVRHGGAVELHRGTNRAKDQSYFLAMVPYATLAECIFPVGDLAKSEVRRLAAAATLPVVHKAESQEVCFVPDNDYRRVLAARAPGSMRAGEIVGMDGRVLGGHDGFQGFTVGQRRGLGVAAGTTRYVVRTEPAANRVVIGAREDALSARFRVSEPNWLLPAPPELPFSAEVQIRYRSTPAKCTVETDTDGGLAVQLETPRFAIAAGQAAVFYRGEHTLGGGWIEA
ncbi:MAG: tRNA 2-thiouridine(34) synthase MnmA [Planctomycetes bacterium]|nr:tRNA 2-thiouridine(34) synthase MnmA [Planctomycetota bacterium]